MSQKGEALRSLLKDGEHKVDELKFILMISQVDVVEDDVGEGDYALPSSSTSSGLSVRVAKASGIKCERCWFFDETVGVEGNKADDLCDRCDAVCNDMGFVKAPKPAEVQA